MKSLAKKLLAFSFVIALSTGCASVTDASLDAQDKNPTITQEQPSNTNFGSDSEMNVILDKPK